MLQWIIGTERYFVKLNRFDYLYYVSCDHNEVSGEGFSLESALEMFMNNWRDYNECGP